MTDRRDDSELNPPEPTYTTPPLVDPPAPRVPPAPAQTTGADPISNAKERLAEGYASASEAVKDAARTGARRAQEASETLRAEALRAREEVERRMENDPLQVIAYSAAIGFVAGLALRLVFSRIRSHDDDCWTELP